MPVGRLFLSSISCNVRKPWTSPWEFASVDVIFVLHLKKFPGQWFQQPVRPWQSRGVLWSVEPVAPQWKLNGRGPRVWVHAFWGYGSVSLSCKYRGRKCTEEGSMQEIKVLCTGQDFILPLYLWPSPPGSEMHSNLLKITELLDDRTWIWTCTPRLLLQNLSFLVKRWEAVKSCSWILSGWHSSLWVAYCTLLCAPSRLTTRSLIFTKGTATIKWKFIFSLPILLWDSKEQQRYIL